MPTKRILIIEDELDTLHTLATAFKEKAFEVELATQKEEGYKLGMMLEFDGAVVDLKLPDERKGGVLVRTAGLDIIRRWAKEGRTMPVLVVTSLPIHLGGAEALEDAGANVYYEKPIPPNLVAATMRNLIDPAPVTVEVPPYILKPNENCLIVNDKRIDLGIREREVLKLLMENAHKTLTTNAILAKIYSWDVTNNAVHKIVQTLRDKIGDHDKSLIRTDHNNRGYSFSPSAVRDGQ